jgi:hypothetical protein
MSSSDKSDDEDDNGNSNNTSSNNISINNIDISSNIHIDLSNVIHISSSHTNDTHNNSPSSDMSRNFSLDCSDTTFVPPIVDISFLDVSFGVGYSITKKIGWSADGSNVTLTDFLTTNVDFDPQITEHLAQVVTTYNDVIADSSINTVFLQIKQYASELKCSDFHGKGSIDDYQNLFLAASKIANESKQMQLDIDIEGFTEFGKAADELSSLFTSFIIKLDNVNIINDYSFLVSISLALGKIVNLSNIFGRFTPLKI